ncbi:hypothetical protein P7K49_030929 [Saguinus oedipus]|uniref:Uncharacterized protein n=1 Tax=Saguinus oedipus TaxID=9490 RepID=A0ABQ9U4G1_SAGOE|nr:hypothetical protein P7K49_030929 [Saguinus oedipus]
MKSTRTQGETERLPGTVGGEQALCTPHGGLQGGDKYAVRFIPHENGVHTIDVKFNGSHVVGSPFKVRVGEPGQAGNPALVSAYGAGLEGGTTDETYLIMKNTGSEEVKKVELTASSLPPPPPESRNKQLREGRTFTLSVISLSAVILGCWVG